LGDIAFHWRRLQTRAGKPRFFKEKGFRFLGFFFFSDDRDAVVASVCDSATVYKYRYLLKPFACLFRPNNKGCGFI